MKRPSRITNCFLINIAVQLPNNVCDILKSFHYSLFVTGFVACHTIVESCGKFLLSLDVNYCPLPIDGAAASTIADFGPFGSNQWVYFLV